MDPTGHSSEDYQVENDSDWRKVIGIEVIDDEWEIGIFQDNIYCNSAGQYLHSHVTKIDGSTIYVNIYLTADGQFDHQDIKIYDPGSSTPRIYDDKALAKLMREKLAQKIPQAGACVAVLIAMTLCEPLDWGLTICGWTQREFSYFDLVGLLPGINSHVMHGAGNGAGMLLKVVRGGDNYLQVPHDASLRGSFDTLQVIDNLRIPNGKWGTANWLEPITKDYPKYGPGGATQAITNQPIKLDTLVDLLPNLKGDR